MRASNDGRRLPNQRNLGQWAWPVRLNISESKEADISELVCAELRRRDARIVTLRHGFRLLTLPRAA